MLFNPSLSQYFSMEAIDQQISPVFYKQLIEAVKTLQSKSKISQKDIADSGLARIIKEHTNITYSISLYKEAPTNACVRIPEIDGNHPLLTRMHGSVMSGDTVSRIGAGKGAIDGWVDLARGKVHGVFEEMTFVMLIGEQLINATARLNPDEVAAVILHEIGHTLTFCELVCRSTRTNFILASAVEAFFGTEDRAARMKFLLAAEKAGNFTLSNREKIADSNSKSYVTGVLLTDMTTKTYSDLGTDAYDANASESVADQYAQRCGAGRALVTGMAKLYRWHPSRFNTLTYILWEVIKFSIFVLGFLSANPQWIVLNIMILINNPTEKVYDEPEERLRRIRSDMVNRTKDKSLDRMQAQQVLADIKVIDEVLEEFNDRNSLYEFVWRYITPWGRKANKKEEVVKSLERLANNDFYVMSSRLRSY